MGTDLRALQVKHDEIKERDDAFWANFNSEFEPSQGRKDVAFLLKLIGMLLDKMEELVEDEE